MYIIPVHWVSFVQGEPDLKVTSMHDFDCRIAYYWPNGCPSR